MRPTHAFTSANALISRNSSAEGELSQQEVFPQGPKGITAKAGRTGGLNEILERVDEGSALPVRREETTFSR